MTNPVTTVVDYGAGNIRSVCNTLEALGAAYKVTNRAETVRQARNIVLPGVGHFGQMIRAVDELGLRGALLDRIGAGVPFLGICVGLQCLFERSDEAPGSEGLGVFAGSVKRFSGTARIPHMGWNLVEEKRPCRLLDGLKGDTYTYFAHSFYAPVVEATGATCTYIESYTAIVERENVFGVQFHPEKSGPVGLRVIKNFLDF